ncbi:MAG: hypothetical protein LUF82_05115 [Clostridia bacterium]|nr:hypothetical protein [Clostridia bacterium]MCD8040878.1 hypothetical protein [Clostridia bacterium]
MENKLSQMSAMPETSEQIIQTDVMRYKRNKTAANFALLSLVFECLYFMVFYSVNVTAFNTITIGISVVVNLCFLLVTMLAEEGIRAYNWKYSITLLALAVVQIIRIFYYPIKVLNTTTTDGDIYTYFFWHTMQKGEFSAVMIIFLVLSAACLVASAIFGYTRARKLEKFNKAIDEGSVSVEAALKDLDEKDAQEVANA